MVIRIEDMRLGRVVKFRGFSDREGDINTGLINGTSYQLEDEFFYVPVYVSKLADGGTDKCMIIASSNIVGVRDA
jgi:hypothetical protein